MWKAIFSAAIMTLAIGCQTNEDMVVHEHMASELPAKSMADMTEAEMMEIMEASGRLGEEHEFLAQMVGDWAVETEMSMGPGTEMVSGTATASFRKALGGKLIVESFKGDFQGMAFEGMALMGYSNLDERHFSTWYDSMTTWGFHSKGNRNDEGVLHLSGKNKDMMTPNGRPYRMTMEMVGNNKMLFDMYDTGPDGKEFKTLHMTYTRK